MHLCEFIQTSCHLHPVVLGGNGWCNVHPKALNKPGDQLPGERGFQMRAKRQLLALAAVAVLTCSAVAAQDDPVVIPISEDRPSLEFVGQFITNGPGAGVSSLQFGYLSTI